ncbi:hypothetical protein VTN77DRAFT_5954 [Rasamsonia byssochlamydoides]|uniref:uncharacterized protein n=1 Tax=Rasamsonia byssochlamydoides TaxID=89139 RepID=UPI0037445997
MGQEGDSSSEFGSEVELQYDSSTSEVESEEEEVGDNGKDVQGDAWYKSAYAVEPDQSDNTDDATESAYGRSFVMDMREALASVQVRREFPGDEDEEMEDVGCETSDDSAVPAGGVSCTCRPTANQQIRRSSAGNNDARTPRRIFVSSCLPLPRSTPGGPDAGAGSRQCSLPAGVRQDQPGFVGGPARPVSARRRRTARSYWPRRSCRLGRQSSWSMGAKHHDAVPVQPPARNGPGPILMPPRARRFLPTVFGRPDNGKRGPVSTGGGYLGGRTVCGRRACPGEPPGACRMVTEARSLSCVGQCKRLPPGTAGRTGVLERADRPW